MELSAAAKDGSGGGGGGDGGGGGGGGSGGPAVKKIKTGAVANENEDAEIRAWIAAVNNEYNRLHIRFENDFWGQKMALSSYKGTIAESKQALEMFLRDNQRLATAQEYLLQDNKGSDEQKNVLACFVRTFKCYTLSTKQAAVLKDSITSLESQLEQARAKMPLGLKREGGGGGSQCFEEMSSVQLRNLMRTSPDEPTRKAAYEGLRSIGPFVVHNGFIEIIKRRNQLAKSLGYEDFYDYKVTMAEGFGKRKLFEILDDLEQKSRPALQTARQAVAALHGGENALLPWNINFKIGGDVEIKQNPYFPFSRAVETWARTFSSLGIEYMGATMDLDLLERKGKYSNGFCHWPIPAWLKPDGTWVPSKTNFSSLADPAAVGSGRTGLRTLLHEGGHAAHFSNIVQPSPLFAQERAPMSVAYAENQSMFLDSLIGDAAWLGKYARDETADMNPIPWELVQERIQATHPFEVFNLRAMIAVPYFEKAVYELASEDLTAEKILKLADDVEDKIQGGLSARPSLSVPHILADESSCYYHGYVLAEMSVYQTRAHFLNMGDGGGGGGGGGESRIVDNPLVGKDLTEIYWRPGNSEQFLDLVQRLTGKPLTSDAWVEHLQLSVNDYIANEKLQYDWAVSQPNPYDGSEIMSLNMTIRLVHGDDVIACSKGDGGLLKACEKFRQYVNTLAAAK